MAQAPGAILRYITRRGWLPVLSDSREKTPRTPLYSVDTRNTDIVVVEDEACEESVGPLQGLGDSRSVLQHVPVRKHHQLQLGTRVSQLIRLFAEKVKGSPESSRFPQREITTSTLRSDDCTKGKSARILARYGMRQGVESRSRVALASSLAIYTNNRHRLEVGLSTKSRLPLPPPPRVDRVRKKNDSIRENIVGGSVTPTLTLTPRTKKTTNKRTG